jgi:hypothetical protein
VGGCGRLCGRGSAAPWLVPSHGVASALFLRKLARHTTAQPWARARASLAGAEACGARRHDRLCGAAATPRRSRPRRARGRPAAWAPPCRRASAAPEPRAA